MKKLLFVILLLSSIAVAAQAQTEIVKPFSYWLKGKIGTVDFEMLFHIKFDQVDKPCASVQGQYFYPSAMEAIEFTGNYYYKDKTLQLKCANGEVFDFSVFDGKTASGSWQKGDKRQSLSAEVIMWKEKQLFIDFVATQIQGASSASEQQISLEKDEATAEECPKAAAYARGAHFAIGCEFEYTDDYQAFYYLPMSKDAVQVLEVTHRNAYTPTFDSEGGQIPFYSTQLSYAVHEYKGGKWSVKSTKTLYEKEQLTDGAEQVFNLLVTSKGGISAVTSVNGVATKLRWQWDGSKMSKK